MKISRKQKRTRGNADLDYKAQERFLMEVAKRTAVAQMLAGESVLQVLRDSLVVLQNLKELIWLQTSSKPSVSKSGES